MMPTTGMGKFGHGPVEEEGAAGRGHGARGLSPLVSTVSGCRTDGESEAAGACPVFPSCGLVSPAVV